MHICAESAFCFSAQSSTERENHIKDQIFRLASLKKILNMLFSSAPLVHRCLRYFRAFIYFQRNGDEDEEEKTI